MKPIAQLTHCGQCFLALAARNAAVASIFWHPRAGLGKFPEIVFSFNNFNLLGGNLRKLVNVPSDSFPEVVSGGLSFFKTQGKTHFRRNFRGFLLCVLHISLCDFQHFFKAESDTREPLPGSVVNHHLNNHM